MMGRLQQVAVGDVEQCRTFYVKTLVDLVRWLQLVVVDVSVVMAMLDWVDRR